MSEDGRRRGGNEHTGSWRIDAWRRARDLFDDYDDDRVCSEELADDLVNELAGRFPRSPRSAPGRPRTAPCPTERTRHLRVVRSGA